MGKDPKYELQQLFCSFFVIFEHCVPELIYVHYLLQACKKLQFHFYLNNNESNKTTIPITASDVRGEDRKRLIRELGRKPSEEKVSLYVRKPSEEQKDVENTTTKKFMDSMARR